MSSHSCLPELLLVFGQACTVLHLGIVGNFFCDFLSPEDLLAKYSGLYFYLAGFRFYRTWFFHISHVLVFI